MPNMYRITVINNSPEPQTLYFFQQPAAYTGGPQVYSNSLAMQTIGAKPSVGKAQIQFIMELQYYAGVQTQPQPIAVGQANTSSIAEVPIDSAAADGTGNDMTVMSIDPNLALTPPVNAPGVQPGAFRIKTPVFDPSLTPYNAGLAAIVSGNIVLSNFIAAQGNMFLDVQPIVKFYVATGSYDAGTVVNFSEASATAATCDATSGHHDFFVSYNADGSWTTTTTTPPGSARKAASKLLK